MSVAPPLSRLTGIAFVLLALALLVSPFRSSAGLRGGLLLLAFVLVAIEAFRRRAPRSLWPSDISMLVVPAAWAGLLLWRAAVGDSAWASLADWKGNVLTPLAGFCIGYAVMRAGGAALFDRLLVVVFCTLPVITVALALDPFRQGGDKTMPFYGGAGAVSAWLVVLAALLPWLWRRRMVSCGLLLAIGAGILAAAFLTGSRWLWICFAGLATTFACIDNAIMPRRRWLLTVAALVLFGGGFVLSTAWRFDETPFAIAATFNDHRQLLYTTALQTIAASPLTGYGVGRDALEATMVAQFSQPEHRQLFLHAHNVFLNQALQAGLPAASMLAAFFCLLLWRGWRWSRSRSEIVAITGTTLLLVAAATLLRNLTDDFFNRQNAVLFFSLVGGLFGVARCASVSGGGEASVAR